MATQTLTLTDFLLTRVAEDETTFALDDSDSSAEYLLCERILADCKAKRGIIEVHQLANADQGGGVGCMHCDWDREWGLPTTGGCDTLRFIATVYADHADYDPAWRP